MCAWVRACVRSCARAYVRVLMAPQSGTADGEMNVPTAENPELQNVPPFKAEVGKYVALYASSSSRILPY